MRSIARRVTSFAFDLCVSLVIVVVKMCSGVIGGDGVGSGLCGVWPRDIGDVFLDGGVSWF